MSSSDKRYACYNQDLKGKFPTTEAQWLKAPKVPLVETESGERAFLHTEVQFLRDDKARILYARFTGEDDGLVSTYRMHDETIYRQDVFELFLCDTQNLNHYKEIEASPYDVHFTGTISFDAQGARSLSMDWDLPGFNTKTHYDEAKRSISSVWAMPYAGFDVPPAPGGSWRVNAYRIDHSARGIELMAWQMTGACNFHVPERFGWLDFPA